MALDRKDVRAPRITKLNADAHERLRIIAEEDAMDMGEWVEQLILQEIERRWDDARKKASLAQRLEQVGVSGNNRDSAGAGGSRRR